MKKQNSKILKVESLLNDTCFICEKKAKELIKFSDLPISELFFEKSKNVNLPVTSADQSIMHCESCSHSFLSNLLPQDFVYTNYVLESSKSYSAQISSNNFFKFINTNKKLTQGTVIDIGANDTFLLQKFGKGFSKKIGIDPNIKSDDPTITCVKEYFENCNLNELSEGKKLIVCSHTLEHIYDVNSFLLSLSSSIEEEDELFFQFPSLDLLIEDARFDQVNHQHINYFSLNSITKALKKFGFGVVKHYFDHDHYGTLMCYVRKLSNKDNKQALDLNYLTGDDIIRAYGSFKNCTNSTNQRLQTLNGNYYSYGASLTLPVLDYFIPEIKNSLCILDTNPSKEKMRFLNLDLDIKCDSDIDFPNSNFFVAAISSKTTARKILEYLIKKRALNIFVPLNII